MRWVVRDTPKGAVIVPEKALYCPFCGRRMLLHDFRAIHQRGYPGGEFWHADVHLKCPNCSFWATFGVPIGPEEYGRLSKSRLNGRLLRWDLVEAGLLGDEGEEVRRRLEALGYW